MSRITLTIDLFYLPANRLKFNPDELFCRDFKSNTVSKKKDRKP